MTETCDTIGVTSTEMSDMEFKTRVYDHIGKYTKKSWIVSIGELSYALLLFYTCISMNSLWLVPLFALTITKLFILFHDMAHNSYFPDYYTNRIVGAIIGTIVLTPLTFWTKSHNYHHAYSNKINYHQHGQTAVWDTEKYNESSKIEKLKYKLMYGKYTLFTVNPFIYFIILNRFLSNRYEIIMQIIYFYCLYIYLDTSQYIYFTISMWLAAMIGILLFHSQHTFDGVYRSTVDNGWSYFKNGMKGCSFLQVPLLLKPFLCNIQYHHIHHLNSNVPCYMLKKCHDEADGLFDEVHKVYLSDIPASLKYSLYNTVQKKFDDVYNIH